MKLSKLNNVVVKNSLYVLLFVISYTALLRYYNTEFFTDTTIDKVFGWAGNHENPALKNQTEESCRQLALKDSKYVAWGYRTDKHDDPNWRNTCFLYPQGFQPFNGNPSDVAHITGCLRPGEKVSLGCKVPPSTQTTQPTSTPVAKRTAIVTKSILDPEYDFNKVVEKKKSNYKGTEVVDFVVQLANELVPEHKQLVCIAFYWFIMKKSDGYKDDNDNWAKSLNEVGLPYEMYANLLPQLQGMTFGAKGTLATLANALSDNMISVYIQNYVQRYKNFVPYNVQNYKDGLERIDWNNWRQQTSDVETLLPTEKPTNDLDQQMHIPLLAVVWMNFLLALPQPSDDTIKHNIWKQGLADVGLPSGLYVNAGKVLYKAFNNTKQTFKTADESSLAGFYNMMKIDYDNFVKKNGKFIPADKAKYDKAMLFLQENIELLLNISVDPSMYTKEYKDRVNNTLGTANSTRTTIPNIPNKASPQVESKPIEVKPIIIAPAFKPYEPNKVDKPTSIETPKETVPVPEVASTTPTATTTTTTVSPTSLFASVSTKFILYILLSIVVSIVFVVFVIWGAISLTKPKTIPNSTF
jgi:hypothetical protein